MSNWPAELAAAIRAAIASGEEQVITVPNGTRKALAEIALNRTGTPAEVARITIKVDG